MTSDLLGQLAALPRHWSYVAVDGQKRPYMDNWQKNFITRIQLGKELQSGRAKAIGVCCGTPSGGLLFVDHDGKSASRLFDDWGIPVSSLPPSWTVTSGRDGRFQIIYQVPEHYWADIRTRKYKTGVTDAEGKPEQVELRWDGCQSIVAGAHPLTSGYSWVPGRSPTDVDIAEAPADLIARMLRQPVQAPLPLMSAAGGDDTARARSFLEVLQPSRADDYDQWLEVGMALHSVDDALLADWINWSSQSSKFKPGDCEHKWRGFKSGGGITLGTLGQLAKQDGWRGRQQQEPMQRQRPAGKQPPSAVNPQLQPMNAAELLNLLRHGDSSYRYNTFTQRIEVDGAPIEGAERFYLTLAEMGYKVSKEVALDCIVQVANESPYDPVVEYLDRVAATVAPAYIEALSTGYLRPGDTPGTIYDEMLKRTLIGAVARAYNPGCKHDSACVIMGDQGAYKSSFWACLGHDFFSDALGDISTKDDLMVLHRSWIMEWAELDHVTNRKHAGQVKAFLSQAVDMFRVPYGKATEAFPRRGIIVGTTNRTTGFLVDETGNRRFWVIPTTKTQSDQIDTATLLLERDAIWSAAVAAYRAGETSRLPAEHERQLAEENESYVVDNPWQAEIEDWLRKHGEIDLTTERLLTEAIKKPVERQTKADQMQVADVLKRLGFKRYRSGKGSTRAYVYRR
jgi:hypothetical protein